MKGNSGKIFDAQGMSDKQLHAIERDILIVGSGAASVAMATRLVNAGLKVLVLEAGDRLVNSDSSPFFEARDSDPFGLSLQFGGSTNLWSGRTAPLEDVDMTQAKGWPFERASIEAYYEEALRFLRLQPFERVAGIPPYDGGQKQWNDFLANADISVKRFQWNRPVFKGLEYFSALAASNANLTVLLNCRALKLLLDDTGVRVVSVRANAGPGRFVELVAPRFALCAGGLETPRILLNSRAANRPALDNPNIGRYFSTHPKSNVGRIHLTQAVSTKHPLFSDISDKGGEFRFGIGVGGEAFERAGRLNHYVQFSPRFESIGLSLLDHAQHVAASVLMRSDQEGRSLNPLSFARRRLQSFTTGLGRILFNVIGKMGLLGKKGTVLVVRGFFDQFPSSDNRIVLTEETDPYGMPKARVSWTFSSDDRASVHSFLKDLADRIRHHGLGTFEITLPAADEPWKITEIHSHLLGTTRMGTSSEYSVTDANGRVHNLENLFVGGASLMTSYGYANPVLTIMALAFLTADKICEQHKMETGRRA
ncbi:MULTISPECIES: GMC oxidoreductase [unclassified Rhizobium]|uniref:GMC oxidoreductase n=1 Tax=unclassified Rhizobium TaxID=2613769 RepID=UPI00071433A7|nr:MULTISPECIES: GMC family oxidoreductase [unclassified Rhizobium]KQS99091.1 hypothetical protein ASG50_20495 [Rhizobium sp. Leaf386]KQT05435.1 hypothetical protein ASG42_21215 [Rhizobium sp. Leaf391]KQT91877.1 hypothetical protein ASG68_18865 [Rhizobium sp. Leaf453]